MKTLYDLLGIERQATLAQIEQGYRHSLDAFLAQQGTAKPEEDQQLRAIAEAYRLLSSPTRRRAYDEKLARKLKQRMDAEQADDVAGPLPWVMLLVIIACVALGGGYYYGKLDRSKARARLEAAELRAISAPPSNGKPIAAPAHTAPQLSAQHQPAAAPISQ
jgi:curved DNA-binding protein CbpA